MVRHKMADRILILGAGVYQVPLIIAARRRGLATLVASFPGAYPGIALADTFVPVDISDQEGILAVARDNGIVAVATAGADAGLPALGRLVDELGLSGPDEAAACRSTNKAKMKDSFQAGGVPSARFGSFKEQSSAREFAEDLGYPVMVKPADSSGSRGVIRVESSGTFAKAWAEARSHCRGDLVIVEQFLVGREYGAQAIVHGSHVVATFIHDDTLTTGFLSTPVGHSMPSSLTAAEIRKTELVVAKAVTVMGLSDCVANVDLMLTEDGPQVIEIGGRMGATGIAEMINLYTGWDIYDHVLDLALGQVRPLPKSKNRPNAVTLLRSDCSGTVLSLDVPREIRNNSNLVDLQWDVAPGDVCRTFKVGPDRLGQLQVTGKTAVEASQLAEKLRSGIKIKVQESS